MTGLAAGVGEVGANTSCVNIRQELSIANLSLQPPTPVLDVFFIQSWHNAATLEVDPVNLYWTLSGNRIDQHARFAGTPTYSRKLPNAQSCIPLLYFQPFHQYTVGVYTHIMIFIDTMGRHRFSFVLHIEHCFLPHLPLLTVLQLMLPAN